MTFSSDSHEFASVELSSDRTVESKAVSGPSRPDPFNFQNAIELAKPLPERSYLIDKLSITSGAPTLFAGYGFSGKTIALQSAALSIAAGKSVWGFLATKGNVLHFDAEQGHELTNRRYQRLARGLDIDLASLGDALRVSTFPKVRLVHPDAAKLYRDALQGSSFAVFDSLRALVPSADENSSTIRQYLDLLGEVSNATGCVCCVIHHTKKPTEGVSSPTMGIRGSSAIFDACGSVFVLSKERTDPFAVLNHEKNRQTGILLDPFALKVADVPKDKDPSWGLRVEYLAHEELAALRAERRSNEETAIRRSKEGRILAYLRESGPHSGGRTALREAIGMKTHDFVVALNALIEAGTVKDADGIIAL
jgi:hypothetical protein